jgi:hypothetical protein
MARNGNLIGPASSTDNAIARFDSTTGTVLQNSGVTIADTVTSSTSGIAGFTSGALDAMSASSRIKLGTFTVDQSTTGDQAVTGVGFLPGVVIFLSTIPQIKCLLGMLLVQGHHNAI